MSVVGSKRSLLSKRKGKRQRVEKEESLLERVSKEPKELFLYILSFLNFDDVLIRLRLTSHYFERFIDLEKRSIKNIVYRKSLLDCNINRLFKNIQKYKVDINVDKIDIIDEKDELESEDIECLKRFSPKNFCFRIAYLFHQAEEWIDMCFLSIFFLVINRICLTASSPNWFLSFSRYWGLS